MSENHKFLSEFSQLEKDVGDPGVQSSFSFNNHQRKVGISGTNFILLFPMLYLPSDS